jgi:hypothetical protein
MRKKRLEALDAAKIPKDSRERMLESLDYASNGVTRPIGTARELSYLHHLREAASILGSRFLAPERKDIS